jgi:hypothetical protein
MSAAVVRARQAGATHALHCTVVTQGLRKECAKLRATMCGMESGQAYSAVHGGELYLEVGGEVEHMVTKS